MRLRQRFFIAACTAIVVGASLGFVSSPGGRHIISEASSSIFTPSPPSQVLHTPKTPTPVSTPTNQLVPVRDGVAHVAYIFPPNNGYDAVLHIEVYASDGTKLAWSWREAVLSSAQNVAVDIPARLITLGQRLRVLAYYTDKSGDFIPFSREFFVITQ